MIQNGLVYAFGVGSLVGLGSFSWYGLFLFYVGFYFLGYQFKFFYKVVLGQ